MAEEKIGGYWSSLKLISDRESFRKGLKSLSEVKHTVLDMTKTVIKFAGIGSASILGFVGTIASLERKNGLLAQSLRISGNELTAWKTSANIAGISADSLTGSMLELEKKVNRMKLGEVDINLAKSLGMLGVGFSQFNMADSSQRLSMVINKAMMMTDKGKAGELVRSVLGDAGKDMFTYLQMSGRTMSDLLKEGKALAFTTDATRKGSMMFDAEMKAVVSSGKEMMGLFGGTLAIELTPLIKNIKLWIIQNKTLISSNIRAFAKELAKWVKDIFNALRTGLPALKNLIDHLGGVENVAKKVGVAFIAFTGVKMLSGVLNLVRGLGGISGALKGLGMAIKMGAPELLLLLASFWALYLILDDIAAYASGGHSVTGALVKYFKELGKSMWESFSPETRKALQDFYNLLMKLDFKKAGADAFSIALKDADFAIKSIAGTLVLLINLLDAISKGKGLDFVIQGLEDTGKKFEGYFKQKGGKGFFGDLFNFTYGLSGANVINDILGSIVPNDSTNTTKVEVTVKDKNNNTETKVNNKKVQNNSTTNTTNTTNTGKK